MIKNRNPAQSDLFEGTQLMKEVQKKAVDNAIRALRAVGCQFAVVTPDGEKLGELQLALPKLSKRRRVHNFRQLGYIPKIKNMAPGDVAEFDVSGMEKKVRDSFRASIAACARQHFGAASHTSTIVGNTIQLIRHY